MTRRGPKPRSVALHVVGGTHRADRHGPAEKVRRPTEVFGKPIMPRHFKGDAKLAWDRYIKPAWWLDASREALAIVFCELWAEFCRSPDAFPVGKHGQMRGYLSDLGLTDERSRGGIEVPESEDEFFGVTDLSD